MRELNFAEMNHLTEKMIGAAIGVHQTLGPGACWNQLMRLALNLRPFSLGTSLSDKRHFPFFTKA